MKSIVQHVPGGPETLEWGEAPKPTPKADEVLIRVYATAFNPADGAVRKGVYLEPNESPGILGLEAAGTIEQVGADVTGWNVGDRVCALLNFGGYAEFVSVPSTMLLPLPDHLTFVEGASLPESLCTVWSNWQLGHESTTPRNTLIHGGSGSVGAIAIQIAKTRGDQVFTTAGSSEGLALTQRLGADHAINYNTEDFVEIVKQHTEQQGADLILDTQGAAYFDRNFAALNNDGHIAVIGIQGGSQTQIDLISLMRKRVTLTATTLKSRPSYGQHSKSEIVQSVLRDLWDHVVSGKIVPVVGAVRHLSEAAQVHTDHAERKLPAGKTVLQIIEDPAVA